MESQHIFSLYLRNTNYFSYFDDKESTALALDFIAEYLSQN